MSRFCAGTICILNFICANDTVLMIGREAGTNKLSDLRKAWMVYTLPAISAAAEKVLKQKRQLENATYSPSLQGLLFLCKRKIPCFIIYVAYFLFYIKMAYFTVKVVCNFGGL